MPAIPEIKFSVAPAGAMKEAGILPESVVDRNGGFWRVRNTAVGPSAPADSWFVVQEGDLVRIPLLPYRVASWQPHDAIAFCSALAVKAAAEIVSPREFHVVVGDPVEEIEEGEEEGPAGFRVWLGFAARMK